jgi:putative hydrolase of the HAD superfamily
MPFRPLGGRFLRENAAVTRAVLLDALGTLVELEPPWEPLARGLGTAPDERLRQAVRAEMAYYREHSHEGRDAASLTELRQRCAAVLSREAGRDVPVGTMMAAIRFRAFPDAAPALAGLRELGLRLVCVSNWDVSLSGVLESCGLGDALDRVVTSAEAGARKPDPAIFAVALELAGCDAEEAVHVGDTPEDDLAGAAAAGIRALLIARDGSGDIASLGEIGQHLDP